MAEPSGILIRGGRVVNEDCSVFSDVYIENGKIVDVGPSLQVPPRVRVIDATDKLVIPGGIDTHTHMELEFMGTKAVDDFYVGTKVRSDWGGGSHEESIAPCMLFESLIEAFSRMGFCEKGRPFLIRSMIKVFICISQHLFTCDLFS